MDFNNDGKLDLVAGDTEGNITFFKNIGTRTEPKLAAGVKLQADGKTIKGSTSSGGVLSTIARLVPTSNPAPQAVQMGTYSKLNVADWDGDGLLDILVGQGNDQEILLYHNIGTTGEAKFAWPVDLNLVKTRNLSRPSPYVVDWDGDGKKDVLLGTEQNKVFFMRNIGTNAKPEFAPLEEIKLPGIDNCVRCRVTVVDWNNDGKLDLLVGTFYSGAATTKPEERKLGGNVWLFMRK